MLHAVSVFHDYHYTSLAQYWEVTKVKVICLMQLRRIPSHPLGRTCCFFRLREPVKNHAFDKQVHRNYHTARVLYCMINVSVTKHPIPCGLNGTWVTWSRKQLWIKYQQIPICAGDLWLYSMLLWNVQNWILDSAINYLPFNIFFHNIPTFLSDLNTKSW